MPTSVITSRWRTATTTLGCSISLTRGQELSITNQTTTISLCWSKPFLITSNSSIHTNNSRIIGHKIWVSLRRQPPLDQSSRKTLMLSRLSSGPFPPIIDATPAFTTAIAVKRWIQEVSMVALWLPTRSNNSKPLWLINSHRRNIKRVRASQVATKWSKVLPQLSRKCSNSLVKRVGNRISDG